MKNKFSLKWIIPVALVTVLWACEEYTTINYAELMREEQETLDQFLTTEVTFGSTQEKLSRLDSLTRAAVDTVNRRAQGGIIYFDQEIGQGEQVVTGKKVGYRFKAYYILKNDTIEDLQKQVYLRYAGSNYGSVNPATAVAGTPDSYSGYYRGLDDAIRLMRRFGKARVIVPSTIGDNSYITSVYDLELVYIEK